ncbi:hypothetical protein MKEN_00219900 [Mycena kentingensis (nom. inval.)]|nr:hypothetical protein MKEN_00219900 [Mycena kentingensis (nom. inval.)]
MTLDPDTHHLNQPRSPPPVAGTIRAKPDHSTNSSDSDEPPTDRRLSPSSGRAIQRRRRESPDSAPPLQPARTTSHQQPAPTRGPVLPDTRTVAAAPPPVPSDPERAALMTVLESALTRAVATLDALNLPGESPPVYPANVLQLLRTLGERAPAATTTTPSYADVAAKAAHAKPSHTTPSVAARTGNRIPPPTLDTTAAKRRQRTSTRRSAQRVIVRWTGAKPDPAKHDPYDLVRRILGPSRISGVMWLPSGNLALHAQAPGTAHQLLLASDSIIDAVSSLWDLDGDPLVELDTPWTNVVLRDVPTVDFFEETAMFYTDLDSQGIAVESIVRATAMVKGSKHGERRSISVKVAFRDDAVARELLKRGGVCVFGAYCQAVRYRGGGLGRQ